MILEALPIDLLWRAALVVVPLAVIVAVVCRLVPCRPSTRHLLWLGVLLVLVAVPLLPAAGWSGPERPLATSPDTPAPVPQVGPLTPRSREAIDATAIRPPSAGLPLAVFEGPPVPAPGHGAGFREATVTLPPVASPIEIGRPWNRSEVAPAPPSRLEAAPRPSPPAAEAVPSIPTTAALQGPSAARQWLTQLLIVRDAVRRLPPVSASVWLGGIAVLLLLLGLHGNHVVL